MDTGSRHSRDLFELKSDIRKIETYYQEQISFLEKQRERDLINIEDEIKNSWRWRIGSFIVISIKKFIYLIKNPVRYTIDKAYRQGDQRITHKKNKHLLKDGYGDVLTQKKSILSKLSDSSFQPGALSNTKSKGEIEKKRTSVGVILDEDSSEAIKPDFSLLWFRPDNWGTILESNPPEFLFVESAWAGNMGSWQYRIAEYEKQFGDELCKLVSWAKAANIPSFFWFNSHPKHLKFFINSARLFDYILTTNEFCGSLIRKELKGKTCALFPFASQPIIHHPVNALRRNNGVLHVLSDFNLDENALNMNNPIINALLKYNLRLMERKLPLAIPMGKEPRIPEFLLPFYYGQKGSSEILSEYRKYKVSINLGFTQLPSREIFESLACGTPVISAYSDAIGDIFGDAVYYTESEKETANQVALLFSNETEWERASVKGIRKVFSEHTYCERFNSLGKAYNLKLKPAGSLKPRVVILSAINNFNELESLANNILRQSFKPSGVILFSKESGSNFELNDGIKSAFGDIKYYFVQFGRNQEYSKLVERIDAEYFAVCGPSDYYGVEYLNDFILATKYHNGGVFFGRASYYEFSGNGIKVNHPGQQFSFVSEVPNGSLFFHKSFLQSFNPNSLMKRDYTFKTFGSNILSVDSMNYIKSAEEFPVPDKFFSLVKA